MKIRIIRIKIGKYIEFDGRFRCDHNTIPEEDISPHLNTVVYLFAAYQYIGFIYWIILQYMVVKAVSALI